jgi:hypothetical protein
LHGFRRIRRRGVETDLGFRCERVHQIDILSNRRNRAGGSRNPAPITTQSNRFERSAAAATASAVSPRSIRQLCAS